MNTYKTSTKLSSLPLNAAMFKPMVCLLLLAAAVTSCDDDDNDDKNPLDDVTAAIEINQDKIYTNRRIQFNVKSDNDDPNINYQWRFDKNSNNTTMGTDTLQTFANAGTHTVELTLADMQGNTRKISKTFNVMDATPYQVPAKQGVRIATFNAGLDAIREVGDKTTPLTTQGQLKAALTGGGNVQAQKVAEIIQQAAPDILLLNEIDGNDGGATVDVFNNAYLKVAQNGAQAINYPYIYTPTCNTGVLSGQDYNNNGKTDDADDAYGYGNYSGKYCMAIFSKYPIDTQGIQTFQKFLWKDMPNALQPTNPDGSTWYAPQAWNTFRLSSKTHIDVPVLINNTPVHLLASHPTPPVFDGDEDRNGRRNFDEIRLWADYINPNSNYLYNDKGEQNVTLDNNARFVVLGDQNASSVEGDATTVGGVTAINQLLDSAFVNPKLSEKTNPNMIPSSEGGAQNAKQSTFGKYHTAVWKMRADYVLPSSFGLKVNQSGVFWPTYSDNLFYLVNPEVAGDPDSSDHRLVWADVTLH